MGLWDILPQRTPKLNESHLKYVSVDTLKNKSNMYQA